MCTQFSLPSLESGHCGQFLNEEPWMMCSFCTKVCEVQLLFLTEQHTSQEAALKHMQCWKRTTSTTPLLLLTYQSDYLWQTSKSIVFRRLLIPKVHLQCERGWAVKGQHFATMLCLLHFSHPPPFANVVAIFRTFPQSVAYQETKCRGWVWLLFRWVLFVALCRVVERL